MNTYKYHIFLKYMYKGQAIEINNTNIDYIVIEYLYDEKNMPMIFIGASIDKNVVDDMIENSKTSKISMFITKYIDNVPLRVEETYIMGEFIYYLSDDRNYKVDLDYSKETIDSKDIYRKVTLGLLKDELINNNKQIINNIVQNSYLLGVILSYMKNMKLLLEPINNTFITSLPIPPINSITKLIAFLDNNYCLFDTKYRLFYDFNRTYLLSSSGNAIQAKDETFTSIILKISEAINAESTYQGMSIENNSCVVYISVDDININEDKASFRTNGNIISLNYDGSFSGTFASGNAKLIRTTTGNLDISKIEQSEVDGNKFCINVMKTDIDVSVFTLNKSYYIQNYPVLKDNDGSYLLSRKREIYTPQDEDFMVTTLLSFRKTP